MIVDKKSLLHILVLLAIFPPDVLVSSFAIKVLLNVVQVIATFFYIAKLFQKEKTNSSIFLILLYSMVIFSSTYLENRAIGQAGIYIMNILGFVIFLEIEVLYNAEKLLLNIKRYFSFITIVNYVYLLIGVYLLKQSADDSLFMSQSNSITAVLIFAIFSSVLYDLVYLKHIEKSTVVLMMVIVHTEILVWSGTGILGCFIMLGYLVFELIKSKSFFKEKRLSYAVLNLVAIGLFVAVTIFRAIEWFSFVIEDILQKDITLTGRTVIWDYYIKRILEAPIIGHGVAYNPYGGLFAHSGYLDIAVKSGFCGVVLFMLLVTVTGRKLRLCNSNLIYNLVAICLFSFEIMMLAEMPNVVLLLGILLMGIHYPMINNAQEGVE